MLVLFIVLFVWNFVSGVANLMSFGKTGNIYSAFVGASCMFFAGVTLTISILKSFGILS